MYVCTYGSPIYRDIHTYIDGTVYHQEGSADLLLTVADACGILYFFLECIFKA